MTLEQHLVWLLYLMSEYPEGWKQHCWRRAQDIANSDPAMSALPQMLTEAVRDLESSVPTP